VGRGVLLLENIGAGNIQIPDSRFDTKLLETLEKHFIGRLLPDMRELILRWREELGVTHSSKSKL
jgi:hypothetical protein